MDTDFNQFNPYENLPDNFFLILYGIRRCGKSNALKQLLYDLGDKMQHHKAYLFSGTAKVDPEQYSYFPPEHQYHDMATLDSDLQEIIDQQMPQSTNAIQSSNSSPNGNTSDNETDDNEDSNTKKISNDSSNHILIVLDDVVNETTVRNSRALNYLAIAGRHLRATVIILSQTIAGSGSVPPIIRTNADAIMLCTLPKASRERDLICEYYLMASARLTKSMCFKIIEQITSQPYRMIAIALYEIHARKITDFVFEYGPVPFPAATPDFKIGTEEQWGSSEKKSEKSENKSKKRKIDQADSTPSQDVHAIHGGSNVFNRGIEDSERHTHIMGQFSLKLAPDSDSKIVPIANILTNSQYSNLNFVETEATFNQSGIPFTRTTMVSSGFLREKPKVLFTNSKKKKISLRRK